MFRAIAKALWAVHDFLHPLGSLHVELITADDTVVLQGITAAERTGLAPSHLRGVLKLVVKRRSVPLDSISVQFIGECVDSVYVKRLKTRSLLRIKNQIINETYRYTTNDSVLLKGTHIIPFVFVLDQRLPESMESLFGKRLYQIKLAANCKKSKPCTVPTQKVITLTRSLAIDSTYHNDILQTNGNWQGILPYTVSLSSRVCQLGGTIGVEFETFPDPTLPYAGMLRYIKITLMQKTKCVELDEERKPTGSYVTWPVQRVVGYRRFECDDDPYEPIKFTMDVTLPDLGQSFQAYTSNPEKLESPHEDFMSLSHQIYVTFGLQSMVCSEDTTVIDFEDLDVSRSESVDSEITNTTVPSSTTTIGYSALSSAEGSTFSDKFVRLEETSEDLTFRAPIFVTSGKPCMDAPPVYDVEVGAAVFPKSFAWICTNGKSEVEFPPLYCK